MSRARRGTRKHDGSQLYRKLNRQRGVFQMSIRTTAELLFILFIYHSLRLFAMTLMDENNSLAEQNTTGSHNRTQSMRIATTEAPSSDNFVSSR